MNSPGSPLNDTLLSTLCALLWGEQTRRKGTRRGQGHQTPSQPFTALIIMNSLHLSDIEPFTNRMYNIEQG